MASALAVKEAELLAVAFYLQSSLFTQQSLHQIPPSPSIAEPHTLQSGTQWGGLCSPPPPPPWGCSSPHGAAIPGGWRSECHPPSRPRPRYKKWLRQKSSRRAVTYIHPHKGNRPSVPSARRRGHRAACLEGRGHTAQLPGHMAAFEHPASILIPPPQLKGCLLEDGVGVPALQAGRCWRCTAACRGRAGVGAPGRITGVPSQAGTRRARDGCEHVSLQQSLEEQAAGNFFFVCVCIYNISRLQLNPHPCLGSSSQGAHRLSPF